MRGVVVILIVDKLENANLGKALAVGLVVLSSKNSQVVSLAAIVVNGSRDRGVVANNNLALAALSKSPNVPVTIPSLAKLSEMLGLVSDVVHTDLYQAD